nr:MAG TPA: hypothetical protein [Caudoviricetes sp.]
MLCQNTTDFSLFYAEFLINYPYTGNPRWEGNVINFNIL